MNPYRFVHQFAVEKYKYDCEIYGYPHGSKMERFTYFCIWPFTVMLSVAATIFAFVLLVLAIEVALIAWELVLTY